LILPCNRGATPSKRHGDRHGTDAAGYGRDGFRDFRYFVVRDIADQPVAARRIRIVDAIHADPNGSRAAMIKWAGLNPDFAGKIGLPLFEKGVSPKDIQVTMDLTYQYKMISRALKAKDVLSDLAKKS